MASNLRYHKTENIPGYAFTFIFKTFIQKPDDAPMGRKQVTHI